MKLAEALILRADVQKKIESLRNRLKVVMLVQEGEKPIEQPKILLTELTGVLKQAEELVYRINKTNMHTKLSDGVLLTEALARREVLAKHHTILKELTEAANPTNRYGLSEIKTVTTLDVATLQKQIDKLAKELRELNGSIQEAGWKAELLD
jgi:hypothetical protein